MSAGRPGYWGEVVVGSYIRSPQGVDWVVREELDGWLRMQNRDGIEMHMMRPPNDGEVWIYAQDIEDAVRVATGNLGAVTVVEDSGPNPWTVGAFPSIQAKGLAKAKTHLWLLHVVYAGDCKNMAELIECHTHAHHNLMGDSGVIAHIHKGGNP